MGAMGVAEPARQLALRAVFFLLVVLGTVLPSGLAGPSTSVAASGIAITGSFYRQAFEIPQGGSAVGPSIYVVVSNQGTDEFNVRMLTAAVTSDNVPESGISINLSRVSFSLQAGAQQKIQVGVNVAESVPAGQYEVSIVAESYGDGGQGISISGSAAQTASLAVTGDSATISVSTVGPSGQPVLAQVRLFRMVGGSGYEVTYSDSGSLTAKVAPGTFSAEAYSPTTGAQLCDPATFDVAAGEDKTIALIARTVYFEDDFVVVPNYDSETNKLLNARTLTTLTNVLQTLAGTEVRLVVTFNGDPLEEITVLGPLSLPVGQTGVPWNYIPEDGWKSGLYGFKYQLYVDGQLVAETVEQTLKVGGGGFASWLWMIFAVLGALGGAGLGFLVFLLIKRGRMEGEKPRREKKRKEEKPVRKPEPAAPPEPVRKPEPVRSAKPVQASKPAQSVRPVQAPKPVQAPRPVQPVQPAGAEGPPVEQPAPLATVSSLKARMASLGQDQRLGRDTEEDAEAYKPEDGVEDSVEVSVLAVEPPPPESEPEQPAVESVEEEVEEPVEEQKRPVFEKPAGRKPGIFSKVTATRSKEPHRPPGAQGPPPVKPEDEIIINWPPKTVERPTPAGGLEQMAPQEMEAGQVPGAPEEMGPAEEVAPVERAAPVEEAAPAEEAARVEEAAPVEEAVPAASAATEEVETEAHAPPPPPPTKGSFAEAARLRMEARQRASEAGKTGAPTGGSPAEGGRAGEGKNQPPSS
jgi:hypothetical protein